MTSRPLSRRRVLTTSATSAAALAALPIVGACSTAPAQQNSAERNARAKLPTYVGVNAVEPDLPGNDKGAMPGYFQYPRDPASAFSTPPAEGLGDVEILYPTLNPIPPAVDRNAFWQAINDAAGANLKFLLTPSTDYANKFQTTIAGGKVPDIAIFSLTTPNQPSILATLFADLSEFVAGDAVKDFPFLANIPTESWKYTVANGSVYGVPQPRALSGATLFYRDDVVSQAGANPAPANYAEFLDLLRAVTDARKNRWAFANGANMRQHIQMMLGTSNKWAVDGGKFVSNLTDERTKEAIGAVADMVKQGLFHPDSASASYSRFRDFFTAGTTVLHSDGYAAWNLFADQISDTFGAIVEPKYDGGGDTRHFSGIATQAVTAIRKDMDKGRIRALVNLLNWFAAPIGTAEHRLRKYGVEGTHFTQDSATPTLTDKGKSEKLDLQYVTDSPTILGPGTRDLVTKQHDWHVRVSEDLVYDPAAGLFSDTQLAQGTMLAKLIMDAENDIFFGRKPLSSWDDAVRQWKSRGGDKIAAEYEKAYSDANG